MCKKRSTSLLYLNGGEKPLYIIRCKDEPVASIVFSIAGNRFSHGQRLFSPRRAADGSALSVRPAKAKKTACKS